MARPYKCRRVEGEPYSDYFKPRGLPLERLEEIRLTVDEFEAVRLADLEELYQEDAARKMSVSRQTFGNIVNLAHRKIAEALVNCKALKIEGGFYKCCRLKKKCCRKKNRGGKDENLYSDRN